MKRKLPKKYLPEFIYGGIDGAITTFAIVSGVVGASLGPAVILILGFANLLADGFSMAASNYLSVSSRRDLHKDHSHENDNAHAQNPRASALATFIAFVLCGYIPLLPFVLSAFEVLPSELTLVSSMVLTGLLFFCIGAMKGRVVQGKPLFSGLQTLAIGGVAATIAYMVGNLLEFLVK